MSVTICAYSSPIKQKIVNLGFLLTFPCHCLSPTERYWEKNPAMIHMCKSCFFMWELLRITWWWIVLTKSLAKHHKIRNSFISRSDAMWDLYTCSKNLLEICQLLRTGSCCDCSPQTWKFLASGIWFQLCSRREESSTGELWMLQSLPVPGRF